MNSRIVCIEFSFRRYQDRTNVAITRKVVDERDDYIHFVERNYTPSYRRLFDLENHINESDGSTIEINAGPRWLSVSYRPGGEK